MEIFRAPRVTLLARPEFLEPEHLRVEWRGEASPGERLAEYAGRLCYMSQHNPAQRTTVEYLENIKKQGHGSVLEHSVYVLLIEGISRSCSHELVRHRAGLADGGPAAHRRRGGGGDPGDGECVSPGAAARGARAVLALRGPRRRRPPRGPARPVPQGLTSDVRRQKKNPVSLLRIAP